jgi:hypothetical protein
MDTAGSTPHLSGSGVTLNDKFELLERRCRIYDEILGGTHPVYSRLSNNAQVSQRIKQARERLLVDREIEIVSSATTTVSISLPEVELQFSSAAAALTCRSMRRQRCLPAIRLPMPIPHSIFS